MREHIATGHQIYTQIDTIINEIKDLNKALDEIDNYSRAASILKENRTRLQNELEILRKTKFQIV